MTASKSYSAQNALNAVIDGIAALMTPPPFQKPSEWSEEHRYLSREYSSKPGRYRLSVVPYAREPMDCAADESVRLVVLMWASQTTKTTILENVLSYFISADPSPILLVQPTVEMAQAWSKERFNATVRDTPVLRDLISDPKSRDSGNTIQLKTFPGGSLAIIGSNAPAGLAARPRRVVLLDEVDRYPASAGTEGDPVALAIRRTESFFNSVIYMTSTPTVKGASRIEQEFEGNPALNITGTDKRKWFVPCPACSEWQTLTWSQVRWDDGKPETARYACVRCDSLWTDDQRHGALLKGEWRATAPFNGKRGYFLNGIYSPFQAKRGFKDRLHQMAAEFLEAKHGGREQLKTWTNTFLAETWEDETERIELSEVASRAEDYSPDKLPSDVAIICGGADVQKNRIEVELVGSGVDDESWGVEVIKVHGDVEKLETWQRFTSTVLTKRFKRADGIELPITAIAIDFHYRASVVKHWTKTHGTSVLVIPVVGIGAAQASFCQRRQSQDGFVHWSLQTDQAKDVIFGRLHISEPGPRYMHIPRGFGYDDEWLRQLTSERVVTRYVRGFPKRIYEKSDGARNEALDMRVYWLACLDILRPDIGKIQAGLTKPKAEAQKIIPGARRGGWAMR